MCVHVHVCMCMRAHVCAHACVRMCACACVCQLNIVLRVEAKNSSTACVKYFVFNRCTGFIRIIADRHI
jgi:hypothetical protein